MNQLLIVFRILGIWWGPWGGCGQAAKRFEAEQLLSFLPAVRIG
jgi:hypothetical protein